MDDGDDVVLVLEPGPFAGSEISLVDRTKIARLVVVPSQDGL